MTRYNVGDKIKIRDDITYYDTGLNKEDHSNLYNSILTIYNIVKVEYDVLIQVEEDKTHLLKPEWVEHIEDKEDKPHLISIMFEPNKVIGAVYTNCKLTNTVELNYPNDIDYNESTASISHKVINKLFPDEEYVAKVNTKVKLEGKEKE